MTSLQRGRRRKVNEAGFMIGPLGDPSAAIREVKERTKDVGIPASREKLPEPCVLSLISGAQIDEN